MTARGAFMKYNADFRGIDRSASPTLPPAPGFQGYEEYQQQVRLWMAWITWEKEDPLVLKDDEPSTFVTRIVFVYKQAVMSLRYWPQMWVDAADYCFENGTADDGMDFLKRGISANPESCLLTFRLAERVEMLLSRGDGDAEIKRQGALVRAPYDALLNCLYDHLDRQKSKHAAAVQAVSLQAISNPPSPHRPEETFQQSHRDTEEQPKLSEDRSARILQLLKEGFDAQNRITCRVITFVWIALLRAMRRVQGKGSVNSEVGGCRQIFSDARKRGRVTSEIYVASALIEWHCYKDPAGTKIFERGMKLFPADGPFAIEYLKHLISLNDVTSKCCGGSSR